MPYDWERASLEGTELAGFSGALQRRFGATKNEFIEVPLITGIVERFGRYVLGTEGWRAEWVMIRKLKAPSTQIGLLLEQAYPDVEVFYDHEDGITRNHTTGT